MHSDSIRLPEWREFGGTMCVWGGGHVMLATDLIIDRGTLVRVERDAVGNFAESERVSRGSLGQTGPYVHPS